MASHSMTRAVFTVTQRPPRWAVDHAGVELDSHKTREEAMASATRRANASQNAGAPAQIRFADEPGFWLG